MDRRKERKNLGFTLAEMLIVVAITGILAAFGFVAVVHNQRELKLTEMDNTAREIYEGAQNHLTSAEVSGTWDSVYESNKNEEAFLGTKIADPTAAPYNFSSSETHDLRVITVNQSNTASVLKDTALKYILPMGAIDETVRSGGNYVIEYDAYTAQIFGVFYTDKYKEFSYDPDVLAIDKTDGRNKKDVRIQYQRNSSGSKYAIGYYGGASAKKTAASDTELTKLQKPTAELINAERLLLKVTYIDNASLISSKSTDKIKMTVKLKDAGGGTANYTLSDNHDNYVERTVEKKTGTKNGKTVNYTVKERYYILDSIVDEGKHFYQQFQSLNGKNIQAEVTLSIGSSSKKQEKTGYSNITNSLYGDGTSVNNMTVSTAMITNARHLENLSSEIAGDVDVSKAVIKNDIVWDNDSAESSFFKKIASENNKELYGYDSLGSNTVYFRKSNEGAEKTYYGIVNSHLYDVRSANATLSYFNIAAAQSVNSSYSNNGGLFADLTHIDGTTSIMNLTLDHFTLNGKNGGDNDYRIAALLGTADSDNVYKINNITVSNMTVTGYGNCTGSLIGLAAGNSTININNCLVQTSTLDGGTDNASSINFSQIGGMVGTLVDSVKVNVNYSTVDNFKNYADCLQSGGIAGAVNDNSVLSVSNATVNSLSVGRYSGNDGTKQHAGGFVGVINGENDEIIINDKKKGENNKARVTIMGSKLSGSTIGAGSANYNDVNEGGFVGTASGHSALTITDSSVENSSINGKAAVMGGMIGQIVSDGSISITNSFVSSDTDKYIVGTDSWPNHISGGLIGLVRKGDITITSSYINSASGKIGSFGRSAGGLVAQVDGGNVKVKLSFVSVDRVADERVDYRSTGNKATGDYSNQNGVGGLIGSIGSSGTVTVENSYVAGRTTDGEYKGAYISNVYAGANDCVGGFVGKADGKLTANDCYTTASVDSNAHAMSDNQTEAVRQAYTGGFIGSAGSSVTLNNVYSTGLVTFSGAGYYDQDTHKGENKPAGAFAGTIKGNGLTACYALKGINDSSMRLIGTDSEKRDGLSYGVKNLTDDSQSSDPFKTNNTSANPYDRTLDTTYAFRGIKELNHVGDWPIPVETYDDGVILYYENVDGEYYYKGYSLNFNESTVESVSSKKDFISGTDASNTDKYVSDDGYVLLLASSDIAPDVTVTLGSSTSIVNGDGDANLANALGYTDYAAYAINPSWYSCNDEKTEETRKNSTTMYLTRNSDSAKTGSIYINPIFAKCISDSYTGLPAVNNYEIRSASQLNYLFAASNASQYLTDLSAGFVIQQTMDIRFSKDVPNNEFNIALNTTYQGVAAKAGDRKIVGMTKPFVKGVSSTGILQALKYQDTNTTSIIDGNNNGTIDNITLSGTVLKDPEGASVYSSKFTNTALVSGDNVSTQNEKNAIIQNITLDSILISSGNGISGNNSSKNSGGIIKNVNLTNCTITKGNGVTGSNAAAGKGIISQVTLTNCTISNGNGVATENAAGGNGKISTIVLDGTTLESGNGVVTANNSGDKINDVTIRNNSVIHGNGVSETCNPDKAEVTSVRISGSTIYGNGVTKSLGSSCMINDVTVENSTIYGNTISEICSSGSPNVTSITISGSNIYGNGVTASLESGGTIKNVTISNSYIRSADYDTNYFTGNGIAGQTNDGASVIQNIQMNDVKTDGSGIAGSLGYGTRVMDCQLHNMTIAESGIATYSNGAVIADNTIINARIGYCGLYDNLYEKKNGVKGYDKGNNIVVNNHIYSNKEIYDGSETHNYYKVDEGDNKNLKAQYGLYELVKIGLNSDGKYNKKTAGFIGAAENDQIYGNSVTGMVYGYDVAGFAYSISGGTYEDNYTNTIVQFAGVSNEDNEDKNYGNYGASFAVNISYAYLLRNSAFGMINKDNGYGTISRFAMSCVNSTFTYCYSAVWAFDDDPSVIKFYKYYEHNDFNCCSYLIGGESFMRGVYKFDVDNYRGIVNNPEGKTWTLPLILICSNNKEYGLKVTGTDCVPYYVFNTKPSSGELENPYPVPYKWKLNDYYQPAEEKDSQNNNVVQTFYGDWYLDKETTKMPLSDSSSSATSTPAPSSTPTPTSSPTSTPTTTPTAAPTSTPTSSPDTVSNGIFAKINPNPKTISSLYQEGGASHGNSIGSGTLIQDSKGTYILVFGNKNWYPLTADMTAEQFVSTYSDFAEIVNASTAIQQTPSGGFSGHVEAGTVAKDGDSYYVLKQSFDYNGWTVSPSTNQSWSIIS